MSKIQFDKYFQGEWKYHNIQGVGIKLSGIPTDQEKFISILQGESCNPLATRRILSQILDKGFYLTTCVSTLNFNRIGDTLKLIGVNMEIIPPIPDPTLGEEDRIALALYKGEDINSFKFSSEEQKTEVLNRLDIFNKQIEKLPYTLGAYE